MRNFTIPFDQVSALSKRDVSYQLEPTQFSKFYNYEPSIEGLLQAVECRKKFGVDRNLLVDTLLQQSKNVTLSASQKKNLESLRKENTFTVITAHQPSLLTGPAYFIIKILSTIRLAKEVALAAPGVQIVPVFILGGEDHDFEEINHLNLFGKTLKWESGQGGAVGRLKLDGLGEVIESFKQILGDSTNAVEIGGIIQKVFDKSTTYGEFMYYLVHELFSDFGLIIANMDDRSFKSAFIPFMMKELKDNPSHNLVLEAQKALEEIGFQAQAFPREINLFYFLPNQRERIVLEGEHYKVLNTSISWTQEELFKELEDHPENFSPNVVMRPIYQEVIWPNIAYVGGGGELAYWLERKTQFEYFNVFMPVLVRRNSLMIISKSQIKHIEKLELDDTDIFKEEFEIINQYLQSQTEFDINLDNEIASIDSVFKEIKSKAIEADPNLGPFAEAEQTRILKQLENIEGRIKRSIKKREETSVKQIKNLKSKLFPNNGLQERHDNFFQFYLTEGPSIFNKLIDVLNPLGKEFVVVCEE